MGHCERPEELTFVHRSRDYNYAEPLIRAFSKLLDEIELMHEKKMILPLQQKLLFIITDAGANDITDEGFTSTVKRSQALNLRVYFVYPGNPGVKAPNVNMVISDSHCHFLFLTLAHIRQGFRLHCLVFFPLSIIFIFSEIP